MKNNSLIKRAKQGFTMIELLVVIGIIGILAAVILSQFSGSTESARATQCMTNMRNLAVAVQNYAIANADGNYPFAGSYRVFKFTIDDDDKNYWNGIGWISWNEDGSASSFSETVLEKRLYAITNGVLWNYIGGSFSSYQCPTHVKLCKAKGMDSPVWSYRMNKRFGFDKGKGTGTPVHWNGVNLQSKSIDGHVFNPDKCLLFAEIPVVERPGVTPVPLTASGADGDCILQADSNYGGNKAGQLGESIGFNHKLGTRGYTGHVAFADGHVEKILQPNYNSPSAGAEKDLTMWLCDGEEIAIVGTGYERVSNE